MKKGWVWPMVPVCVLMPVMMVIVPMMMMVVPVVMDIQNNHAGTVDDQTQYRDEYRLVKRDVDGIDESRNTLKRHVKRKDSQQYRACEPAQRIDLARAKTECAIGCVATRVGVGKGRDAKRDGVGRHVQAVGKQRHRAVVNPGDYLNNHHHGGDANDHQGSRFARSAFILRKGVVVLPKT